MKVATFNVNSVRPRLPLVLDWLNSHNPDVMCLQETKVQDADFPVQAFKNIGYHATYRGMKAYNGVARSAWKNQRESQGPDNDDYRIIQTVIRGIPIINTYVPQGYLITSERYAVKLAWFQRLKAFFEENLDPKKPALWMGDVNVVYHPDKRIDDVDFHIDARNAYTDTMAFGFVPTPFNTLTGITTGTRFRGILAGVSITSLQPLPLRRNASELKLIWKLAVPKAHRTTLLFGPTSTFDSQYNTRLAIWEQIADCYADIPTDS